MSVQVVAFEAASLLYERAFAAHWNEVFRFALARTNDWSAAEDLAQDAFIRLWQHRDSVDWDRPILPWLLVTSRRLATDRFRALRRRVLPHTVDTSLDESDRVQWLDVQAAMASLSPLERTALALTALQGMTYDEAAEILGGSAASLRAAVSRARAKLEVA